MAKTALFIVSLIAICYLACRSPELLVSSPSEAQRSMPDSSLSVIYGQSLYRSYEYMFSSQTPQYSLAGENYGKYIGGIKGILLYSNLKNAIAKHLSSRSIRAPYQASTDFYSLKEFESLAGGIPAFQDGSAFQPFGKWSNGKQDFNRYNPKIVDWGAANLIPSNSTSIGGVAAQALYDHIFSRFFRLMSLSYIYLRENDYNSECKAYEHGFAMKSFNGLEYLEQRYLGKIPEYDAAENFSAMTTPIAIGFWLRRRIDKSEPQLWQALQKVMNLYDKAWFTTHVNKKFRTI